MSEDDRKSALFALLIEQQSSMAFMFLGHAPHPDTGEPVFDLDTSRTFVDQLDVLKEKTRGNLTAPEERMLESTLTALRLAFVEAVQRGGPPEPEKATAPSSAPEVAKPESPSITAEPSGEASPGEESSKKFSKKY